jgi:hypothetical protein
MNTRKKEFLSNPAQTYKENIGKKKSKPLEFEEMLGEVRKRRAAIDLEFEAKGKPLTEKKSLSEIKLPRR